MKRKTFLQLLSSTLAGAITVSLTGCKQALAGGVKFIRSGGNAAVGHMLWQDAPEKESGGKEIKTDVLIIGGGVSGLTTAYFLQKHNINNFLLLELDEKAGGNSKYGENSFSKYPYAAHYLPIPNANNQALIDFLVEKKLITGFNEAGEPFYDEYSLCHEPEERLLINNYWQEGIVPNTHLTGDDEIQIRRFFELIETLKKEKGADGKYVFEIPLFNASRQNNYLALDKISFAHYLNREGYTSPKLLWYLRYCCRDDYGQSPEKVSAFAGLHYFASRRGTGANCEPNSILTWPEGNGRLVEMLSENLNNNIHTGQLVRSVRLDGDECTVLAFDTKKQEHYTIQAARIVMAVPCFVRKKIMPESMPAETELPAIYSQPWLVATVTVKNFTDRNGFPLSWDNVAMAGNSLGFVFAQHQSLISIHENFVFTLYKPLDENEPKQARHIYFEKTDEELQREIITELSVMLPGIEKEIIEIDCYIHGHGMVSPGMDYLMNPKRQLLSNNLRHKVYFAHTDYSGISIFEEAFAQGLSAATEIIKQQHA